MKEIPLSSEELIEAARIIDFLPDEKADRKKRQDFLHLPFRSEWPLKYSLAISKDGKVDANIEMTTHFSGKSVRPHLRLTFLMLYVHLTPPLAQALDFARTLSYLTTSWSHVSQ